MRILNFWQENDVVFLNKSKDQIKSQLQLLYIKLYVQTNWRHSTNRTKEKILSDEKKEHKIVPMKHVKFERICNEQFNFTQRDKQTEEERKLVIISNGGSAFIYHIIPYIISITLTVTDWK